MVIDSIGQKRVGAIITDGPKVMTKARRDLVSKPAYKHILDIRCMMHAFALLLASILGHPFAKDLVHRGQRVVTFVRASHFPNAKIQEQAEILGISGTLKTSNKTRFTSVLICLESVLLLESALVAVARQHANLFKKVPEVIQTINDRQFWVQLEGLCKLLRPVGDIIMGVQRDCTTCADITR
jgi:hypothetical protein